MDKDDHTTRADKTRLFWTVFRIDKGLSLRLGRPSTIQEWDVPMPAKPTEARWSKTASIQGRVYEQLYSVSGLSRPYEERIGTAATLVSELQKVMSETSDHGHVCSLSSLTDRLRPADELS